MFTAPREGTKNVMKTICRINPIINYRILNRNGRNAGTPHASHSISTRNRSLNRHGTLEMRLDYLLIAAAIEEQFQLGADTTKARHYTSMQEVN